MGNDVSEDAETQLIDAEIDWLKSIKAQLSGDASGLRNAWEELCVQVQIGESVYWDVYEDMIKTDLNSRLEQLEPEAQLAIWLKTREGIQWKFDVDLDPELADEPPPALPEDITRYLWNIIQQQSDDFTNARIERYRESY